MASLLTSPMTQQVIQYPTRITEVEGVAKAPRAISLAQFDPNVVINAAGTVYTYSAVFHKSPFLWGSGVNLHELFRS